MVRFFDGWLRVRHIDYGKIQGGHLWSNQGPLMSETLHNGQFAEWFLNLGA